MSKEMQITPEFRFTGFTDNWKLEELGNCLDYLQPTPYLVESTDYSDDYDTPVLTAGKSFILGYTNEKDGVFNENLPVIIFDDFNTASKYVDFPFKTKSSAMKILLVKNRNDIKFVFESMQTLKFEVGVHKRHWISVFSKLKIPVPSTPDEQQKIASCLSSLDELIAAHTDKLDALKDHKKGLLQNLFPDPSASSGGKTVPKVRFPEFEGDGEWEMKHLEEVAKITTGDKDTQDKIDDGKYPFFVRSQTIERINSYSFDGEAILTSGDGVGVGKIYHYIIGKFDFHQRVYCIYDFEKDVEGKFIFYFFSEHFYQRVMQLSAKNSVDSVRRAMITEMPVTLPPTKQEQQKIASCLSAVDELITAQQEKIEQLQQHKKGLMQGLFPKIES